MTLVAFFPGQTNTSSSDVYRSAFYEKLAQDTDDYAVLNVPVSFAGARGGAYIYEYAQTIHHKPIVSGYIAREPDRVEERYAWSSFIEAVRQRVYEKDKRLRLGAEGLADASSSLGQLGVRYVIAHRPLFKAAEWKRVNAWLERALGEPVHEDHWIRAYRASL